MDNNKRMIQGLVYDPSDNKIMFEQAKTLILLEKFNKLKIFQFKEKERLLKKMFGSIGDNCYITTPFYANWGGKHAFFGNGVYANFNLTLVDDGNIYVGDNVMFGPNVTIATANHPINPELRLKQYQYNKDVHIGKNVWIGANVVVCPGVTIGDNTVIGAGSVVTKDIPSNVVAYGNPCRVAREINERDKEYFYKNEKIDYENL